MEYKLKNGKTVIIRKAEIDDAASIINIISIADIETKFLSRNPGEFSVTEEEEKTYIRNILNSNDEVWFVAEYAGKVVGQSSVQIVGKTERYRHRAEVTFIILKDYCNIGIGGKLMQQCIQWCKTKNIIQIELSVNSDNIHAINMYKNFGFKETGTKPKAMRYLDGSFADEILMVKEL